MASFKVLALAALLPGVAALVQPRRLGACSFDNEPTVPFFWDESCPQDGQSLGCLADGVHAQCRFCGVGDYSEVLCPASACSFDNPPHLPYYWDESCLEGGVGCLADGQHEQCRFCGEFPYNGTVRCPAGAVTPVKACEFDNEPETPHFWDATCEDGMVGCKADGKHIGCRFCGAGDYAEVQCPASLCTWGAKNLLPPAAPLKVYWEPLCWGTSEHILGCLADGIHAQCRYCSAGEYASIPCQ